MDQSNVVPRLSHPRSLRAARAIAEALFCSEEAPAPADRISFLLSELDLLLTQAGWRSGGFYKLGLYLVAFLAPLMIGRPLPLTLLPIPDRVRALRRMERSFAAAVLLAVKAIMCLIYYEHPEALGETGFVPALQAVTR